MEPITTSWPVIATARSWILPPQAQPPSLAAAPPTPPRQPIRGRIFPTDSKQPTPPDNETHTEHRGLICLPPSALIFPPRARLAHSAGPTHRDDEIARSNRASATAGSTFHSGGCQLPFRNQSAGQLLSSGSNRRQPPEWHSHHGRGSDA